MIQKPKSPCDGCEKYSPIAGGDICIIGKSSCHKQIQYQATLKAQAQCAWGIVDWLKTTGDIEIYQRGYGYHDVIRKLEQQLSEQGIERNA